MNNLRRLDLNLLVTLDVLLAEHNVTRAAEKLNMSQPSVSVQLQKLRDVFGDPLLLPGPRGMRPTARAEALREPLRDALEAVERAVIPATPFDPATATNTWRVAATDYGESTIVLPALHTLRSTAPGMRRLPLFVERYVLIGRAGHPKLKRRPTLAQFGTLEHVIVSPDGGGFFGATDEALAKVGIVRRVVLSVPHFLFVMSAVASTDLVAMVPERLVRDVPALRVVDAPVDVPGYEMSMLWHERVHRDPAHRWLRETIAAAV
ncbi:LysR family transcriptional regulator [Burkholderia cenocepacia]|nr:LysR family transcriptional regulator [Burkholderia cenocepacia]RQV79982.1 LysR family transcriptional regulator [Burkholderia cenocepacia]